MTKNNSGAERTRSRRAVKALTVYDETFLDCRDLNHHWQRLGMYRAGSEVHRRLTCVNCGSIAIDRWKSNGERIGRTYSYASGYLLQDVKVTRHDVRVAVLNRVPVYNSEAEMLETLTRSRKRRAS